uniref:Zinc transporter 10-like isoform X2 n=1 Tax=Geotrypetes seraphini TaxID=260995 RepID=A0A6P8S7M8_GEOSA|nr:zinc transporter 10-like isoform X2 [Geotrypetes seraphini]
MDYAKQKKNEEESRSDILQPKIQKHQILSKFQADFTDRVVKGGPATSQEDLTWNGQVEQCRSDENIIASEKEPELQVQLTEESQVSSFKDVKPGKVSLFPKVKVELVPTDAMRCHVDDSLSFDSLWKSKGGDENILLWTPCIQGTSEDQEQIWSFPTSEENMAGDDESDFGHERSPSAREDTLLHFVLWLLKSLLSPSLVLTNGLLYHFLDYECLHTGTCFLYLYLDPIFCLITVIVLVTAAFPLLKSSGYLLLQGVPAHMDVQKLEGTLKSLPELEGAHELHVWQLSGGNTIASVHIMCINLQVYTALEHKIQSIFYREGINTFTIQPEFLQSPGEGTSVTPALCSLSCGTACSKQLCCDRWRGTTSKTPHPIVASPSEASSKELIFSNIYT